MEYWGLNGILGSRANGTFFIKIMVSVEHYSIGSNRLPQKILPSPPRNRYLAMARSKQTSRKSSGGKAPRKQLATKSARSFRNYMVGEATCRAVVQDVVQ